jgi:hypothetical protein
MIEDIKTQYKEDEDTKKRLDIQVKQLLVSTEFKRPRLEKIKLFEDAYYGKQKQRFRIQFNIPLPVLSGMVDGLKDAFDDEIALRLYEGHPADHEKITKIQSALDRELTSYRPNAMWDYKSRADKFLAILSGRGIQKTFAESDPKFQLNFEVVDYRYFHCEPKGGGILGNHLFKGEEGVFRTREQLINGAKSGLYNRDAVKKILTAGKDKDYKAENENIYGEKLNRFEALGFSPENNNYVGQEVYHLCEWYPMYKGKMYYSLFDPFTKTELRGELLEKVFESKLDPYTSWATHEDPKVFWSKSYCDDFYVAHDSIGTLISQEFTNRQKKNMTPKFYDNKMINAAQLDASQYRHDALVPVNTYNGARRIADSIYQFEVKELGSATIELTKWFNEEMKSLTGTQDITDQSQRPTGAQVTYSKLQSASKRLSHRAKSFQEAYAGCGLRAYHGFVEHMSEPIAIKVLGTKGYAWDYLIRSDLKLEQPVDPKVVSISEEDEQNVMGKDQKNKAILSIIGNPVLMQEVNPKKIAEVLLKDIGGWKEDQVSEFLEKSAYTTSDLMGKADASILLMCKGKKPDTVYDATTGFLQRILDFKKHHQNQLGEEKVAMFDAFIQEHMPIAAENMSRLADQINSQKRMPPMGNPAGGGAPQPQQAPQNAPQLPVSPSPAGPEVKMQNMTMGGVV